VTARVYEKGRRIAAGAGATSVHWLGETALFSTVAGYIHAASLAGETRRIEAHDGAILCAALHPDKALLLTGGDDGRLAASMLNGETRTLAQLGSKWIEHLVSNSVSKVIVAAIGKEAVVLQNDVETHRFSHASTIGGLAIDQKGRRLAIGHYGGVTLRYALMADDKGVGLNWAGSHLNVTLSPDASYVVSAMQENELHGWRLPEKTDLRMSGYAAKTRSFSWDKRGRWLATSGADCAGVWPFVGKLGPQGKAPLTLAPREALVSAVAFHPSEEILAIGYSDGAVLAVRLSDQIVIELDEPGEGPVTALAWSGDGLRLAAGDEAGRAAIVDLSP